MSDKIITLTDQSVGFGDTFTADDRQVEELGALLQKIMRTYNQIEYDHSELVQSVTKSWDKLNGIQRSLESFVSVVYKLSDRLDNIENYLEKNTDFKKEEQTDD